MRVRHGSLYLFDLKEQRRFDTKELTPSCGPWKWLTSSVLPSPHPSLFCHLLGVSSLARLSIYSTQSWLALSLRLTLLQLSIISVSPSKSLQQWRWRQHASPKCWLLPTSPHVAKTQKNITDRLFSFNSCLSSHGINLVEIYHILRYSVQMAWHNHKEVLYLDVFYRQWLSFQLTLSHIFEL
jgi:hypothetical protein